MTRPSIALRGSGSRDETTGGFLILVAALFALLWLSQIAGAITSGQLPTAVSDLNLPTSAVYVLDLASPSHSSCLLLAG